MKLGVPKEPEGETRVGIVPSSMKKLAKAGFEVMIESGAGHAANYHDADYEAAGATIVSENRYWRARTSSASAFRALMESPLVRIWRAFPTLFAIRNTSRPAWTPTSPSSPWT